jgi:hypothetical protein
MAEKTSTDVARASGMAALEGRYTIYGAVLICRAHCMACQYA